MPADYDDDESDAVCTKCQKLVKNNDLALKCDGFCEKWYHIACTKIKSDMYKKISELEEHVLWMCNNCKKHMKNLKILMKCNNKIENDNSLDIEESLDSMKKDIQTIKNAITTKTYSEVLQGKKQDKPKNTSVIIKSKVNQDPLKTQREIQEKIKPNELKIGITKSHPNKQGNLLINCSNKEESEALKLAIERTMGDKYEIKMPNLRLPRVKIVNYNGNLKQADIEERIRNQNKWITEEDNFKITYIKHIKNKNTRTIFGECTAGLFHKMMEVKKLCIGWERYPIYEDLTVPKCYNCQGFYHKSIVCKSKMVCHICAGEHDGKTCENQEKKCKNCLISNTKYETKYDTGHAANDKNCPSYKYQLEIIKSKIDYKG